MYTHSGECPGWLQGFTFPVKELFLEDVLELTRFPVSSDQGGYNGGGGGGKRRKTQEKKRDPISEAFEVRMPGRCRVSLSRY